MSYLSRQVPNRIVSSPRFCFHAMLYMYMYYIQTQHNTDLFNVSHFNVKTITKRILV